jgi:glucosamine--fructose-6-phosphate aminotransferase (isomerizing)
MGLREEIHEQPAVVERLARDGRADVERAATLLRDAGTEQVVVAARGTSDHAAIYAQYVFGARLAMPVALAAPSLVTLYGVEPRYRRSAVLGISQSGESPDVVAVVESARRMRAPTIAISNTADSPLARAADVCIDLRAGDERAVAATKTYTAELTAIAMLATALADPAAHAGTNEAEEAIGALAAAMATALELETEAQSAASARRGIGGPVVLGRGFEYATAREWALKLKELARLLADPYSAADFQHGPLALLERGFPVFAVAPSGPPAPDLVALLERLRDDFGVDLLVISDRDDALALGTPLRLPSGVPDWLMPIVSIVPAQLVAYHLARARGLDPDSPRHIRKVTLTR